MSSLLTNYSFLSPLKRQRAVRNRAAAVPTPSKCTNPLPVLPELSGEQELPPPSSNSLSPPSPSSRLAYPNEKRFSRYGRDEFSFLDGFHLDRDFLTAAPRAAPNPPSSSANSIPQSVRLSAFDILIDAGASEPASPTFETPVATSTPPPTRPCDLRLQSPPRSRSPTPSLTSMSACSSNTDIPTTPFTSDDEWPGLQIPQKAISPPRVLIRPLVIVKSTPSLLCPDINTADTFEFTLAPFSSPLGLEDEEQEVVVVDEAEDDMSWYARELSQIVSLPSPRSPSSMVVSPNDTLLPPSRGSSSNSDRRFARSRMSKPLPALPRSPGPSSQLDPTFPRYNKSRRPLRPPIPNYSPPPPPMTTTSTRKPLTITVPRAPPRTPLPSDVSDILDDIDSWSFATPFASSSISNCNSATLLSPPRVPQSPGSSAFSEYDPMDLIVDYASLNSAPIALTEEDEHDDDKDKDDGKESHWTTDEEKLRSRWSCSTLATLAAAPLATSTTASPPRTPTSASSRLRFHLGSVARRVARARRDAVAVASSKKTHARTLSSESTSSASSSSSSSSSSSASSSASSCMDINNNSIESGGENGACSEVETIENCACSGIRRKPIPLELFLR